MWQEQAIMPAILLGEHILLGFRRGKPLLGCSKDKMNTKGQKLNIYA